jgi:DNA/RNA endonuclease YhcR with UshA esterase domain
MVALSYVAVGGRASAHHSIQAQFDVNKSINITGTVARIEFINPHSYLTLNVRDADGTITKWAFEMTAVQQLRRAGLSRADRGGLKTGDEITVTALASRDGSNSGLAQEIKTADGRVFKLTAD